MINAQLSCVLELVSLLKHDVVSAHVALSIIQKTKGIHHQIFVMLDILHSTLSRIPCLGTHQITKTKNFCKTTSLAATANIYSYKRQKTKS